MVTPPALMAAIPVGARTTIRFGDLRLSSFRKVVFPVPALPVRNKLALVFSIMSQAFRDSSFISILLCILMCDENRFNYRTKIVIFIQQE